jgi:hypothetical protein
MPMYIRDAGTWKARSPWIRNAGAWKKANPYVRHSGVWKRTTPSAIVLTGGTPFGDGTLQAGLAAAFNGATNVAETSCAAKNHGAGGQTVVGTALATSACILSAVVHGSNNSGYVTGANPTVVIDLYGRNGTAPSGSQNGTLLGSLTFTDSGNESAARTITSTDTNTFWDYVWVRLSHNDGSNRNVNLAELLLNGWI